MSDVALLSPSDIREIIAMRVARMGSQYRAAAAWGVSREFVSQVLSGDRTPGRKILAKIGYERLELVRYRKK